ncbi:Arm DNA-binding domain-containing protein [Parashewanella curva]|uniref:Arm DNA-binding domain-containing protein n=1 Tax=Parashewanella curva TaxID=2338552 RepID=UPI001FB48B05|nr:Arm DNA-binding domain-containing protein [Parashewanella curva]
MPIINKLSAKTVEHLKSSGKAIRKFDGGGLYIYVKPNQTKFWEFRYTRPTNKNKACIGLGSITDVSLADARSNAQEMRRLLSMELTHKYTVKKKN